MLFHPEQSELVDVVADFYNLYPCVAVLAVLSTPPTHHGKPPVSVVRDAVGSDPEGPLLSTIQPVGFKCHCVLAGLAYNLAVLDPPACSRVKQDGLKTQGVDFPILRIQG